MNKKSFEKPAEADTEWALQVFFVFFVLLLFFNSQSIVNYAKTFDDNKYSNLARDIAKTWHANMEKIGATGPRKLFENLKNSDSHE